MNAPAVVPACDICRIHGDAARYGDLECHRGAHWLVRHHPLPSPLVGWTFLCAVRHVQGPADFTDAEADGFGRAMRSVSAALRSITGCDRVYAIAFGQGAVVQRFQGAAVTGVVFFNLQGLVSHGVFLLKVRV